MAGPTGTGRIAPVRSRPEESALTSASRGRRGGTSLRLRADHVQSLGPTHAASHNRTGGDLMPRARLLRSLPGALLCVLVGTLLVAFLGPLASLPVEAATITGTVTGPDGAPLRGAFVQARNAQTRITVSVLSDKDGKYRVENLPA